VEAISEIDSTKKIPDVGVRHRGSTGNKLGGSLIPKYILNSGLKIISKYLKSRIL